MSLHIGANKGDIAEKILLPGDPLRAKYIADNFLTDTHCYNEIRGMLGFTGTYKGNRVSVQGTGMGVPSFSIYANELITQYDVKTMIRVGSCGSLRKEIKLRDLILSMSASTDSNINNLKFPHMNLAPTANFNLLQKAYTLASEKKISVNVGNVLTSDIFYDNDNPDSWKKWATYGVLAVEMETAALYTLAARFNVSALSILTVSDSLVTKKTVDPKERQNTFNEMVEIALEI